jgi:hypothetical protein
MSVTTSPTSKRLSDGSQRFGLEALASARVATTLVRMPATARLRRLARQAVWLTVQIFAAAALPPPPREPPEPQGIELHDEKKP